MSRPYSQDLRDRVIEAALSGKSARGSAAQYRVGVATAIVWVRRARESGDRSARKQGGAKPCKLDPHRDYLLALIDETPDLTISELLDGFGEGMRRDGFALDLVGVPRPLRSDF